MEVVPIIFSSILFILAVVLAVVGIQLVLVLLEVRKTLRKLNAVLDSAEQRIQAVVNPLQNLGGMASGLQTGFKVFESFVGWLHRTKDSEKKN
jgi:uncharacterized protein YoxC